MAIDKLHFSKEEQSVVEDKGYLILKHAIIKKVVHWYSSLEKSMRTDWLNASFDNVFPELPKTGKISRGENYKQLPYVVLDFPAIFSKNDILAYRSIFWWGNYFSNQLIVKGNYYQLLRLNFSNNLALLQTSDAFLDLSENPWNHDISEATIIQTRLLNLDDFQKTIATRPFFKVIWTLPLQDLSKLAAFTQKNYTIAKSLMTPVK